jgi:hypothetical protein
MKHKIIVTMIVVLVLSVLGLSDWGFSSRAQIGSAVPPNGLWQAIDENQIVSAGQRLIIPERYRTFRANQTALRQLLAQAPMEFTAAAKTSQVVLSVPMPDGALSRFRIEQSPVMQAGLAARFPNIKTYRGKGIDDPTATARFDLTPEGFHGIVLRPGGTVLIDPYAKNDTANYITYFKRDVTKTSRFQCHVSELSPELVVPPVLTTKSTTATSAASGGETNLVVPTGNTLRTYMLALAATAEYVNVFRQPTDTDQQAKERALVQMVIIMNRVNGVYERDLAMHMTLIDRELDIIYTNAATDPYTNDDGSAMLDENQANLDSTIGSANYDIGHVFSTGGGGVAQLRVPCKAGQKAFGVTGLPNPTGDVFAIDYVAHEMGHQWGGNHTFNGVAESCGSPLQRNNAASMEPGSGSTIQGYAGICSTQDLQPNSDDYFHIKSLEEITTYTTGTGTNHEGNTCDDETATGNTVPVVDAGANYTIPKDTPFMLTATGSDTDGDALTYAWEEYDAGGLTGASPPDDDQDGRPKPIFRSYDPKTSPSRMFPSLQYILNNANQPPTFYTCGLRIRVQGNDVPIPCLTGEALPSINRVMNFQVTARDNRASGGGVSSDLMQVTVVNTSGATVFGPFNVTQPNTNVTWTGLSTQTVTWNVANTNMAPVNTANVKISLSIDGGNSFPVVLAASTPNDGSQAVTVPNIATNAARIKVEAVDNIFFDISDANFAITAIDCATNFALASNGGTVTASSEYSNGGFPASTAIDGEHKGLNWGNGGGWNDGTRDIYPDWLEVGFNGSKAINEIRVYTVQTDFSNPVEPTPDTRADYYGLLDFEVQYWDGNAWVTVPNGSITNNDRVMRIFSFPEITTTKIRVWVTDARVHYSRITEVEAFGCSSP